MSKGLPLRLSAQIGALSATYALEVVGTQNHDFTPSEFVRRFRKLSGRRRQARLSAGGEHNSGITQFVRTDTCAYARMPAFTRQLPYQG